MNTSDFGRWSSGEIRSSWLESLRLNHESRVLSFFFCNEGEPGAPLSTPCACSTGALDGAMSRGGEDGAPRSVRV